MRHAVIKSAKGNREGKGGVGEEGMSERKTDRARRRLASVIDSEIDTFY